MNKYITLNAPSKIAVIGAGISGLATAYQLASSSQVTVFEADNRFGGHARTVVAGKNGDQPVDTGFIVFNYANYPHVTRMFKDLDVPVEKSNMSFGATVANGKVEYALSSLNALFAQRRNLLNPKMYGLVRDIFKFGKLAEKTATDDMSMGELIKILGLSEWFVNYYLLPIAGAIWSTPPKEIRSFPAKTMVSFFRNHALLEATNQHQWWTVSGGSTEYVARLVDNLKARGVEMRSGTPIQSVNRYENGVELCFDGQAPRKFDAVVFACHSDDALRLIAHPTQTEMSALSDIRYQDNNVILHADTAQMPRNKKCWSSWVYQSDGRGDEAQIGVTYWMNRLQNIDEADPLFTTLNPFTPIDPRLIYDQVNFRHPIFDHAALNAQKRIQDIQGHNNCWFAGAYLRHGFHEDGFASAVRVADGIKTKHLLVEPV